MSQTLKIIILGDKGCGKTSLVKQYKQENITTVVSTIALDYHSFTKTIHNNQYQIEVYDTAGDLQYEAYTIRQLYRANLAIICLDLASPNRLDSLLYWSKFIDTHSPQLPTVVVGTKSDLVGSNCLTYNHIITSSKCEQNVVEVFEMTFRLLVKLYASQRNVNTNTIQLSSFNQQITKSNGCC